MILVVTRCGFYILLVCHMEFDPLEGKYTKICFYNCDGFWMLYCGSNFEGTYVDVGLWTLKSSMTSG